MGDKDLFGDNYFFKSKHVYTKFEAWMDLKLNLLPQRISARELSERWLWHRATAERFIVSLIDRGMVEEVSNKVGQTARHLTIRKQKTFNGVVSNKVSNKVSNNSYGKLFESFWNVYPRKVGKGAAWDEWRAVKPDGKLAVEIVTAVKRQVNEPQWRKDNGQFIPHPSTWLHQKRWLDEPVRPANKSGKEKYLW